MPSFNPCLSSSNLGEVFGGLVDLSVGGGTGLSFYPVAGQPGFPAMGGARIIPGVRRCASGSLKA